MDTDALHRRVFRSGSRTYFNSSLFFPKAVRRDVFTLYGFVRVADDFVDSTPQQPAAFAAFVERYRAALSGSPSGDPIIDAFVDLSHRARFEPAWTDAFLRSMELDLHRKVYTTVEETLEYVYGSAEVIGLYMARIMGLPLEADHAAKMLGRAMQFINFIRDIDEDNALGRIYLPIGESALEDLSAAAARRQEAEFRRFIGAQIDRYRLWQQEAERGYRFIPRRYLLPIRTASDMYGWTAARIERDPFVVYRRKVKPSRMRIVARMARNALLPAPSEDDR